MRVLIVNTSEKTGGAAVASNRLMDALNNNGLKAKMLVRDKQTDHITVAALPRSPMFRWHFLWERWCIFRRLHFSRDHLFEIDIANSGSDITSLPEFKEADVIHLAWINQGMLSLNGIRKILDTGKPVVWTMHDAWPSTAICHYTHGCPKFKTACHECPLLPGGGSKTDLSNKIWHRKQRVLHNRNIYYVTCSEWLGRQARQSALLRGQEVVTIPNPIDTRMFCPKSQKEARQRAGLITDKQLILFVSQRVTDKRKGIDFLIEAVGKLIEARPELKDHLGVAILGGHSEAITDNLPLPVYSLGYISDEKRLVDIYNSANVFVLPSLEDNLPNTIMESMACGVPCVGFRVGGIPEMIDHKINGYVAEFKDASDFAAGLFWVLHEADHDELRRNAVQKVQSKYSQTYVSQRYIEVYNQALAIKEFHL